MVQQLWSLTQGDTAAMFTMPLEGPKKFCNKEDESTVATKAKNCSKLTIQK